MHAAVRLLILLFDIVGYRTHRFGIKYRGLTMHRRTFVSSLAALGWNCACQTEASNASVTMPTLLTRGVVLLPEDLTLQDWPQRAHRAGLTTIGIHHQYSPQAVITWIRTEVGQRFLATCLQLGLQVEFELHALKELLPRTLFAKNPEFFRLNDKGNRTPDANCCVHSRQSMEIIAANAKEIAKVLSPTTGRYFFWGDDGQPWCQCTLCKELSPSEQALIVENHICQALRRQDARATVAHLAYLKTLPAPKKIKPAPGIFLEYAPINRRYDLPYEQQQEPKLADGLHALDENLQVFPKETTQVLEYWLDVSRFSKWKRPAVKLPWRKDVFLADVRTYHEHGIRHVTSFAAWVDTTYQQRFPDLDFIDEYGTGLRSK
jgi:hypothetical protein